MNCYENFDIKYFLAHIKTKILEFFVCQTKLYILCVDDCFAVFNNDSSLDFLSLHYSQRNNIKFTLESALQFTLLLDFCIKVNNDNIVTWI